MSMDYEKCYVFQPADRDRPRKRRRLEGLHKSLPTRRELFKKSWADLDAAFDNALQAVNAKPQSDVEAFINAAHVTPQVPCGLVLSQPGSSSLDVRKDLDKTTQVISIDPTSATNLKNALKAINSHAVRSAGDLDIIDDADDTSDVDDMREATPAKSLRASNERRLLAYDLLILEDYVRSNEFTSVVIHLEDTEGFSGEVLSSLIIQLALWRDRIPLSLLMSLSTSIDMLERRLTSAARKKLKCILFEPATCQQEFDAVMGVLKQSEQSAILGSKVINWAAQRQDDFIHDITCLRNELKYALMTAYFANPLSVFLHDAKASNDHYQALRATPAFKERVEALLEDGDIEQAKRLMTDDNALHTIASPLSVQPPAHVFAPKPRQAIERALAAPQDYLGCDEHSHKTALFAALLGESGNLVNIHDAWQAFKLQDESLPEATMLALFQRALAELKHIGSIKSTRKRVDHVAKAVWPGL